MKLTVDAAALREALKGSVAEKKTAIEVLSHALLHAEAGGPLTLTTTNLEVMYQVDVEGANVTEAGKCTAHVALLKGALKGLEGEVSLSMDRQRLMLSQPQAMGLRRFRFDGWAPEDFPLPPLDKSTPLDAIEATTLREAIQAVAYAQAVNDIRLYLNGVILNQRMVCATDGHRAAIVPVNADLPLLIIPRDATRHVIDCLGADGATCSLHRTGNDTPSALSVKSEGSLLWVRLIDGTPPDVARIIPKTEGVPHAVVDPDELRAAVERLCSLDAVSVLLEVSSGMINLKTGKGDAWSDSVPCNQVGDDFCSAFDPKYLSDMLACARDGEQLVWNCGSAAAASHFAFDGRDDIHIVMPQRL